MPFMFKLSMRLALMKAALAVAAAAAVAACGLHERRVTDPTPPNVVQVVTSPNTVTLDPYQTSQFLAYGRTQSGDSVAVASTWSASGGSITAGGLYTADTIAGTYAVTAAVTGTTVTGISQVKNRGPLVQVIATPGGVTLAAGNTQQFSAYGKKRNGDSVAVSVTWSATGGTITPSGFYTAGQAAGSFHVTAKVLGGVLADSSAVTVTAVPVASVTVSPSSASAPVGQTVQLTATPKDASGSSLSGRVVMWATSTAAVATVSGNGLVSGVAAGTATITATSEGHSGTAAVTVTVVTTVPVASVAVSPASASVTAGRTVQLTATPQDANGNPLTGRLVTWASTNTAVATVSGTGVATGVAAGSVTITASSEGQIGAAAITVTALPANPGTVADLVVAGLTDSSVTLAFTEVSDGTGLPASYDIRYAVAPLSWGSAASVGRGTCTTPVAGSAIGARRTCTVLGLAAGTSYQFQLVAFRGPLTGPGTVFGGLSNVASGTTGLSSAPVATVTVLPASVSVAVGSTQQFTATLKDASGNALTGRIVTWASSAPLLATVSGNGLATGVLAGVATITATSEAMSGSAALTVSGSATGGTVLFQETFEDAAFATRGWYDNTALTIDLAQHITGSAASLPIHFTVGATTPTWGAGARHLFTPTSTLYVSYWVKHSTNWVGSGLNYDPHMFHVLSTLEADYAGPAASYLDVLLEENYRAASAGAFGRVILQDARNINPGPPAPPWSNTGGTENRAVGGCNGLPDGFPASCYVDGGSPTGYNNGKTIETPSVVFSDANKSAWHHVEIYLAMNSVVGGIGQLNGVVRYWLDGVLVMERTNVLYRTGQRATMQFKQFMLAPYMEGSPVDQTMWVDNLIVATDKP